METLGKLALGLFLYALITTVTLVWLYAVMAGAVALLGGTVDFSIGGAT